MMTAKYKANKLDGGRYQIIATTDDVDRENEIVYPTGCKNLDAYMDNPIVLYAHDWSGRPIGKAVSGLIADDAMYLTIEFADTEDGREVRYLYDEGFLTSFSIGFQPHEGGIERDEKGRITYKAWDLLEVSAVPIPANENARIIRSRATMQAVAREAERHVRSAYLGLTKLYMQTQETQHD